MNTAATISVSFLVLILLFAVIALGMWGCPQYGVYNARMVGQGELAQAQGNRQALVATAQAQNEAAQQFAEATSRRVDGWVSAAQAGCIKLDLPRDRQCEQYLIAQAQLYSIAKEGHEGVDLVIGSGAAPTVAVGSSTAAATAK